MAKHEGDGGLTSHPHCGRISKSSGEMRALGDLDELNSTLGLLSSSLPRSCDGIKSMLGHVQKTLFKLGEVCAGDTDAKSLVCIDAALGDLERSLAALNEEVTPLRHFILPEGHPAACHAHVARAVCRRAERALVALAETGRREAPGDWKTDLAYLNRLSEFLFAAARVVNQREGVAENRVE